MSESVLVTWSAPILVIIGSGKDNDTCEAGLPRSLEIIKSKPFILPKKFDTISSETSQAERSVSRWVFRFSWILIAW